jgi:hypothetical protein
MAKVAAGRKGTKRTAPRGKGNGQKSCSVEGCKRGYRAKGYCFFHYKKWRGGELTHSRYKTCSTADCRKPATMHGMCETHHAAWRASRKGAKAEAAAATPAAPAAA